MTREARELVESITNPYPYTTLIVEVLANTPTEAETIALNRVEYEPEYHGWVPAYAYDAQRDTTRDVPDRSVYQVKVDARSTNPEHYVHNDPIGEPAHRPDPTAVGDCRTCDGSLTYVGKPVAGRPSLRAVADAALAYERQATVYEVTFGFAGTWYTERVEAANPVQAVVIAKANQRLSGVTVKLEKVEKVAD